MSSALAMVLMAGMAVPGNGPEKVSGEVEQRLDLHGEWEGVIEAAEQGIFGSIRFADGKIYRAGCEAAMSRCEITDEGNGQLHLTISTIAYIGIYRRERDELLIAFRNTEDRKRPTTFQADGEQGLLILHRVKRDK
jgi:hypothetical protein